MASRRGFLIGMTRDRVLRRRIRIAMCLLIVGLVVSGVTAIPVIWELNVLARILGEEEGRGEPGPVLDQVIRVRDGLADTYAKYPFVAYGTDWLAFAHVVIAIAFLGPLRDPVRNVWVVHFGIIACVLVIPMALVFGPLRGIPFPWRLVDCSFGIGGLVPLLLARQWIDELSKLQGQT